MKQFQRNLPKEHAKIKLNVSFKKEVQFNLMDQHLNS